MAIGEGVGLGTATARINVDTSGLRKGAVDVRNVSTDIQREFKGVHAATMQVEGGFGRFANKLMQMQGVAATLGISLGVGGVAGVVGLFTSGTAAASDLAEAMNKVGVAFGDSGDEILAWSKNSATALGQSRQQALEAASSFGLLFSTMGVASEESAEMSKGLLMLATDMASINNISIDEALIKLRAGLVGEVEPLRTVGVLLNAAAVEAKVLEMGLAGSTDAITEQDKVMARYQLILEQTKLTQGDFARTSGELANQQRITAAAAKDARAAFGDLILPQAIEFVRGLGDAYGYAATKIREFNEAKQSGTVWGQEWFTFINQPDPEVMGMISESRLSDTRDLRAMENEKRIIADITAEYADLVEQRQRLENLGDAPGVVAVTRRMGELNTQLVFAQNNLARLAAAPPIQIGSPFAGLSAAAPGRAPDIDPGFTPEQQAAQLDYWQNIQEIDRQAHSAIQQATEQYGEQRASTVAQFEKGMARESEDFARQRARAVAEHERQIADIRQDAGVREAEWTAGLSERIAGMREDAARRNADQLEDHNQRRAEQQATYDERIAELREDGLRGVAKIEADARRERERSARQHRDTILGAAASLDARAVAQEMRRWQSAQADQARSQNTAIVEARAGLKERLAQEQENYEERLLQDQAAFDKRRAREARDLQLRIDQEQAAHAKRLADARAADEHRIIDMQEAFDERIAQEDTERGIRLGRQRQDHDDQLREMARAQGLRIQQIGEQQAEQRAKLNDEFQDQLEDLGMFNTARIAEQQRFKDAATKLFDDMWGDWYTTMDGMHRAERELAAAMGPHPRPLDYPSLVDPMSLPGGRNPAMSTRSHTITIAPGAVVINALPGMNEDMLGDVMEARLARILEETARE